MPTAVEMDMPDERWRADWPECASQLERLFAHILRKQGVPVESREIEISALLCDDARIQQLNEAYRGKDKPTNVLSFPSLLAAEVETIAGEGPPLLLGDLALAYETTRREAEAKAIPLADHAAHLVIHGILHLLGFDHETDAEAEAMEAKEIDFCRDFGIANPYGAVL